MAAVFHSVLGCRTERRVFGNEAPKKQMVRWIVPVTHLPACYVRLVRRGGAISARVLRSERSCAPPKSPRISPKPQCLSGLQMCLQLLGETARMKDFPNKASALIDQPNSFILKSSFCTTNLSCSIDTTGSRFKEAKYKAYFLSPLFSQLLTSIFYQAIEMRNSSILIPVFINYLRFTFR